MSSFAAAHPSGAWGPASADVLALTADEGLADVLRRLAAVAGVGLDVRSALPSPATWAAARTVLLGVDLARDAVAGLPGRLRVILVALAGRSVGRDGEEIWRLAADLGVERVAVLPAGQEWVVQALVAQDGAALAGRVLAVVGGCGGAGASVLAAAVAVRAARQGQEVLLVDLDPLGGGVDLLLGAEEQPGLRWPGLAGASGRLADGLLRDALPRVPLAGPTGLSVLSWSRDGPPTVPLAAVSAVATAAVRGFDVVVLDLARTADESWPVWSQRVETGLVVVPPTVRAVAAASSVVARLDRSVADLRLVVRGPAGRDLPARSVAGSLGLPLFASVRPEPGLDVDLRRGRLPGGRSRGPLARVAGRILAELPAGQTA